MLLHYVGVTEEKQKRKLWKGKTVDTIVNV